MNIKQELTFYNGKPCTLTMFGSGYGSYTSEPKTERNTMNMRQELALLEIRFENRKLLERIAASDASNGYEAKIFEAKAGAFQIAQDDVNELIARVGNDDALAPASPVQMVAELVSALERIAAWDLPQVRLSDGVMVSYESYHGSNGTRDYVRKIAQNALDGVKE